MKEGIRILIVEDEFITQKLIKDALNELGYNVSGEAMDAAEAISCLEERATDLAILDIQIQGEKDGVWLGKQIREKYHIPFIFLTANADAATVKRATETEPNGYLVKPFNKPEIFAAIETALRNFVKASDEDNEEKFVVGDAVFVKENQVYKKIRYEDICYIKSEGHYLEIHSKQKRSVVRGSLKDFIHDSFIQIHRSYIINLNEIEGFGSDFITVNKKELPLAASYKDNFLRRVKTL